MIEVKPATCTRRIQFCAGHRILGHDGQCANMHGHNYVAYIHAVGPLDGIGVVIDFADLKNLVGGWIAMNWDHAFICCTDDGEVQDALEGIEGQRTFLMTDNPTAESMAFYLLDKCRTLLSDSGIAVFKIELWETENCYATAEIQEEVAP